MLAMRHRSLRQQVTLLVGLLCFALVCIVAVGAAYIAQSRVREVAADRGTAHRHGP